LGKSKHTIPLALDSLACVVTESELDHLRLIAGIFLVLLSLTGSLMVFEDEIDRALNPKLTWVQPGGKRLSLTEIPEPHTLARAVARSETGLNK
jgi:hypothetical protein